MKATRSIPTYMVGWKGDKNVNDSEANGMGKEE